MNSKAIIESKSDILEFFYNAATPRKELLIGLEVERSGVFDSNLKPVNYHGNSGYLAILKKLVSEVGWKIIKQDKKGNIFALKRAESEIHLEEDGRLELVSKPRKRLTNLCREYQMHIREINDISKEFGVHWLSFGNHPFAKNREIKLLFPSKMKAEKEHYKKYYKDFQENIFTKMTSKSNGIHVNFGYTSEQDAIKKFQTLLKISPILTAMFANSPINSSKFSGFFDSRLFANSFCSPHRTQIQKTFFDKDFNFEKWVDFLLGLPMRRIERGGKQIYIPLSFKQFLKKGFLKHKPRIADFYQHIKSVWSEARIKHYLEYRGFDTVPPHLVPSIPTIIRALTLDFAVMNECQKLVKNWTFADQLEMRKRVYKRALQAETPNGEKIIVPAKKILEIASASLRGYRQKYKVKTDVVRLLRPIKEYVFVKEQSPAEYVMEMWRGKWHKNPRKLLEWSEK